MGRHDEDDQHCEKMGLVMQKKKAICRPDHDKMGDMGWGGNNLGERNMGARPEDLSILSVTDKTRALKGVRTPDVEWVGEKRQRHKRKMTESQLENKCQGTTGRRRRRRFRDRLLIGEKKWGGSTSPRKKGGTTPV